MFESWPELWGGGYPAYRTTLRKFLWFRTVTGGNAPEYDTVIGRIVSFLTQRIAPLKIEAALSPIQDLHGQDAPWPAGGGKNKFDQTSFTWSQNQTLVYTPIQIPNGTYTFSTDWPANTTRDVFILPGQAESGADSSTNGVCSGTPRTITVTDGYYTLATRYNSARPKPSNYNWQLESGETATTYSPYSNICPISGHTGADVTGNGVNQFDGEVEEGFINTTTGQNESNANRYRSKNYTPVKPNTTYWLINSAHAETGGVTIRFYFYDRNKTFISSPQGSSASRWMVTPDNCYYVRFFVNEALSNYNNDISINYPSTDHDYHAYVGTTVTISFGQTVYGGTLTVNEDGTGTVKARPYYASYNGETLVGPWVSSMDAYVPGTTPTTGAQVVDMGGTETTIPLTPGQVNALQGNNTVWVDDSSEIKVTFRSN